MNQIFEGQGQTLSSFCTNTIIALKLKKKIKVNKRWYLNFERTKNSQFLCNVLQDLKGLSLGIFFYFKENKILV